MAQRTPIPKAQSQPSFPASVDKGSLPSSRPSSTSSSLGSSRSTSPASLRSSSSPESLINKIHRKIKNEETFFSLEFFPPRTAAGAVNLMTRLAKLVVKSNVKLCL